MIRADTRARWVAMLAERFGALWRRAGWAGGSDFVLAALALELGISPRKLKRWLDASPDLVDAFIAEVERA